jgi:TM2 domain-containing membrane protein YozV
MDPRDISDRSRGVALALAAAIGPFGAHRFYVGKIGTGLAMLCTLGGLGIWWIYDVITIAAGAFRDMDGNDGLRADMGELAERVDFMERMVARSRSMEELPPP